MDNLPETPEMRERRESEPRTDFAKKLDALTKSFIRTHNALQDARSDLNRAQQAEGAAQKKIENLSKQCQGIASEVKKHIEIFG